MAMGAIGLAGVLAPWRGVAQNTRGAAWDSETVALSRQLIRTLPSIRPLGELPPVSGVVSATRVHGDTAMVPVSAALGFGDLLTYQRQLESIFSISRIEYPRDSITRVQQARAAAWIDRLRTVPAAARGYAVSGWETLLYAEVAVRAGQDSVAQRLFDARIAELQSRPVEQSTVLYKAVAAFADPAQDSARLVRNLVLAEAYLKRLQGVRGSGYRTLHDSVTVLYHQWSAEDTLVTGYDALGDTTRLLAHVKHLLSYATIVGVYERSGALTTTYARVVHALASTPVGRAQIVAFSGPLLAAARRAAAAVPPTATAAERERVRSLQSDLRQYSAEQIAWFALLNTPAAPITAHLWMNTPDSIYEPAPRSRAHAQGQIQVLAFGEDNVTLSALNRIRIHYPARVAPLVVMQTSGRTGPDAASPGEESVWLTQYYRGVRHLVVPIALWAGTKRQTGVVPEGYYPVFAPEDTPNEHPYLADRYGRRCVIIDTHGIIRFYDFVETRRDEAALWRHIDTLLRESPDRSPIAATPTTLPPTP